jgi:dihydroorotase
VAHISSGQGVELVRQAKARGLPVTCEAAPHHFTLTDEAVRGYDTNTKMNPPLRAERDIEEIKKGLRDGAIDIIATDHAPHGLADKDVEYSEACFGIVGLETALPLSLKLVTDKVITLSQMIDKLAARPAAIFNLDGGTLGVGKTADITIFDPASFWTIDASKFKSKSKNSPFNGWKVQGKVLYTLVNGKIVYTNSHIEPE